LCSDFIHLSLHDDQEQYWTTTKVLLQSYVNIACVWAARCERVCQSRHMQCIISLHSPHAAGKRASMHHVLLAAGVISCFRLLWCVLQLQWKDRYTSVSAVSAPRPRLPGEWGWGAVSRLYLVRPVRWSNHPNISIRLTSSVASGFGQHVMPPPASNADL